MNAWDAVVLGWVALILYGMRPYKSTKETVTIEVIPNAPDDEPDYEDGKLQDR